MAEGCGEQGSLCHGENPPTSLAPRAPVQSPSVRPSWLCRAEPAGLGPRTLGWLSPRCCPFLPPGRHHRGLWFPPSHSQGPLPCDPTTRTLTSAGVNGACCHHERRCRGAGGGVSRPRPPTRAPAAACFRDAVHPPPVCTGCLWTLTTLAAPLPSLCRSPRTPSPKSTPLHSRLKCPPASQKTRPRLRFCTHHPLLPQEAPLHLVGQLPLYDGQCLGSGQGASCELLPARTAVPRAFKHGRASAHSREPGSWAYVPG